MSPECVCDVLAQNTPQIFLYRLLKLIGTCWGFAKTHWLFKYTWAATEGGVSRSRVC